MKLIPKARNNDGLPDALSERRTIAHEDGQLEYTTEAAVRIEYHISNIDGSIDWEATAQRLAERLITERMETRGALDDLARVARRLSSIQENSSQQAALLYRKDMDKRSREGTLLDKKGKFIP